MTLWTPRRVARAMKSVDRIAELERKGARQSEVFSEALEVVAQLQLGGDSPGMLQALARASNAVGKLSRELDRPAADCASHHLRAFQVARILNDPNLAIESLMNAAHCLEVALPRKADEALRTAHEVLAVANMSTADREWRLTELLLRRGQFLEMRGLWQEKAQLYAQQIAPRIWFATSVDVNARALATIAYSQQMIEIFHLDDVWATLQDPSIYALSQERLLVRYDIAYQLGQIYALSGESSRAEAELERADGIRIANGLTPRLTRNLERLISRTLG